MRIESLMQATIVYDGTMIDLEKHEMTKAKLKIAKSSLTTIARELGVCHSSVTLVSQGYRRSARIETAIASKLGLATKELYPERYLATDGSDP